MLRKSFALVLLFGALAWAMSACGGKDGENGGDGGSDAAASQEIVITATNWQFDQAEYVVPKDTPVKLTLKLEEGGHGIAVDGADIKLGPGKTSKVVTLKEGTYEFKCNIMCGRGHADMHAKLVVK